jgi:pteridine reductase
MMAVGMATTMGAGAMVDPTGRPLVVVTGAAKRVGRATALALAERGCDLVLTYRTSDQAIAATRDEAIARARAAGHAIEVRVIEGDLSSAASIARLAERLRAACGTRLAGLVHNASSYAPTPFGDVTADEALGHFTVNALAPLLLTQALAAPLREANGAVVLFSDIHALGRPRKRFSAYSMSKAAASDLVATLALELAPTVRVNGIAPGVIAWPEGADPAEVAAYEARIPLGRPGTPEEAASLVAWILFEASYLTGETIRIDGGRWLR